MQFCFTQTDSSSALPPVYVMCACIAVCRLFYSPDMVDALMWRLLSVLPHQFLAVNLGHNYMVWTLPCSCSFLLHFPSFSLSKLVSIAGHKEMFIPTEIIKKDSLKKKRGLFCVKLRLDAELQVFLALQVAVKIQPSHFPPLHSTQQGLIGQLTLLA